MALPSIGSGGGAAMTTAVGCVPVPATPVAADVYVLVAGVAVPVDVLGVSFARAVEGQEMISTF